MMDVIDYTSQSVSLGSDQTAYFDDSLEVSTSKIAAQYHGSFIKRVGDAILLFFENDSDFLDFTTQFRKSVMEKELDCGEFAGDVRMVAHHGKFAMVLSDGNINDVSGPEAITIFRIEKEVGRDGVFVTGYLLNLIKEDLKERGIISEFVKETVLKGFDRKISLHRLIFPEQGKDRETDILTRKMKELERDTFEIPVFGGLYPPMYMKDNFVNLDINSDEKSISTGIEQEIPAAEKISKGETPGWDSIALKQSAQVYKKDSRPQDVETLYKKYNRGVVFGLPGSGKTTILKYFAFREFKENRESLEKEKQRVVLFIQCRNIMDYSEWRSTRSHMKNNYSDDIYTTVESILSYFLHTFLFDRGFSKVDADNSARKAKRAVQRAYYQGRLSLLVDALDEAPGKEAKEKIVSMLKILFEDTKMGKRTGNRIYLTSRYSEKEGALSERRIDALKPIFDVRSLDMEQLREMARYFYRDQPVLFKEFDQVVWKEEIAAKVGGTPLTALLVIAYFESFKKFDTRYYMYHVIVVFILIRAWKEIKEGCFNKDMKTFFKEAKSVDVLKEETYKDAAKIFDALTILSYGYMGKWQVITEEDIIEVFIRFARELVPGGEVEVEGERWLKRLKEDHLLLIAGASEYVFIHATVMEYLAARYLVEKVKNPGFLEDKFENKNFEQRFMAEKLEFFQGEAVPIAVGSGIQGGATILRLLKKLIDKTKEGESKDLLMLTAVKCLAEWESFIDRKYQRQRLEFILEDLEKDIAKNKDAVAWVYLFLKFTLLNGDKTRLKEMSGRLQNIYKLTRPDLLEYYITPDELFYGDAEMSTLRQELLYQLMERKLVEQWLMEIEEEKMLALEKKGQNLLVLDSKDYHPEDKNFKYYYKNITGKSLAGFLGSPNLKHSSPVNCIAFSTDGNNVISGSDDSTLKLWDVVTGKEIRTFKGHKQKVTAVDFSPDGRHVLSGSEDCTIKLWDVTTGKEVRSFIGHKAAVTGVCFIPGLDRVISASDDKSLKLWELSTGKENRTLTGHNREVTGVNISPDGKYIISASSDSDIKLWEMATGNEMGTLKGHNREVNSVGFSWDGKYIISGSSDCTIKLWETNTGKEMRTFKRHDQEVNSVELSPDGKYIISGSSDSTIKLWDAANGEVILTFTGHNHEVTAVGFSPGGKYVISGSRDATIKLWDTSTGKEALTFKGHHQVVTGIGFSPDGKYMISGSWDSTIKLWDTSSGKEIRTLRGHSGPVTSVGFSPDGKYAISGYSDFSIKLWDIDSGKEMRIFKGHKGWVTCLSFSPEGKYVISGSSDDTLKSWEIATGKHMSTFKGHSFAVTSVIFSPDGQYVISGSSDDTIKMWDAVTGKEIRIFNGHGKEVTALDFSHDGRYIISASSDTTLKLWDAATGKQIRTFPGHNLGITGVVFSANGRYIISSSYDFTIKIWEVETGQCIRTLELFWIPLEIKEIPGNDGFFVTANANGTVTIFDFCNFTADQS